MRLGLPILLCSIAAGSLLAGCGDSRPLTGGGGPHPTEWFVDPTANPSFTPRGGNHGWGANADLASCQVCHGIDFDGGTASVSCNSCHASFGNAAWRTSCTFCHGTAGRTGNVPGTDALLEASPPVGSQGEAVSTALAVGAHQAHLNPPATGRLSSPLACGECHPTPLPANIDHVLAGPPPAIAFGTLATTGGVTPSWDRTSASCSATYCHGNFTNGIGTNVPVWTGSNQAACGSCHGLPPDSGQHYFHVARFNCSACHSGIATGGPSTPPINNGAIVGPDQHVNGQPDVVLVLGTWNATAAQCTNTCHAGTRNW